MKIVALIPARQGSKRIPNKNVRQLGGLPLLAWSILSAVDLGIPCYLSSDSEEYLKLGQKFGALPILRPESFATDDSTDLDVIAHASQFLEGDVLYLRPTTPFRALHVLKDAIRLWQASRGQITGLRSVEELPESIDKCFWIRSGILIPVAGTMATADQPQQRVRATYKGNGYVDITERILREYGDDLSSQNSCLSCFHQKVRGSAWGDRCGSYITPPTIELDTEEQWLFAEWYMKRHSIAAKYQKWS